MIINDLHQSISDMTEDELLKHIKEIRALRRMIPERSVRKTKASGKKKASGLTVKDHIEGLGEAGRKVLLEQLLRMRGEKNGEG